MTDFPSSGPVESGIPQMTGDPLKSTAGTPIFNSRASSEKYGQGNFANDSACRGLLDMFLWF